MSSENEFHEEKREEIAEQVSPWFKGGPIWKRPAFKVGVIWLLMTIVGVAIGLFVPDHILPRIMSPQGKDARDTIVFFTVLAAPVAALVCSVGAYSLLAWRKKANGDQPPVDGPPLRGNPLASSLWVGGSVVLVVILLIWGMGFLASETAPQSNLLQVNVTGQQWLWTFSYPGTGPGKGVESNKLILPEGRQVQFNITGLDVTHGFWPVEFGQQVDANPGFTTRFVVKTEKLGNFDVRCSQLCGLFHAYMYAHGKVVTTSDFTTWLQDNGATAAKATAYAASGN